MRAQSPQTPAPAFEVASIKPNNSGDGRVMMQQQPGGRFTATNIPLRLLIRNAYQLQDFQIVGAPSWINSERYDIVAKAEDGTPPETPSLDRTGPNRIQLMIRSLLAERFQLVAHDETRELPIYALVVARSDGKLGPDLKKSEVDCNAVFAAGRGRGMPPPPPPGPPQAGERPQCGIRIGMGNLAMGGAPLPQFANSLAMFVGRTVQDKTGLAGNYDVTLTWTPDQMPQRPPGAPRAAARRIRTVRRSSPRCRSSSVSSWTRRRGRSACWSSIAWSGRKRTRRCGFRGACVLRRCGVI